MSETLYPLTSVLLDGLWSLSFGVLLRVPLMQVELLAPAATEIMEAAVAPFLKDHQQKINRNNILAPLHLHLEQPELR